MTIKESVMSLGGKLLSLSATDLIGKHGARVPSCGTEEDQFVGSVPFVPPQALESFEFVGGDPVFDEVAMREEAVGSFYKKRT